MRTKQSYEWNGIGLGTCYYSEHWDRSLWRDDLRRMKQHGIFTVRIAEFAWTMLEPEEGVFRFDFFDEFLDLAEAEGMKVIIGTPTATPPAWLTEKYPEVLNCRIDGIPYRHGMRRHYNYNSLVYRRLCARIVEQIAAHYGQRPCVIGWQIDNELNCEADVFYAESDTLAFREYLKAKYHTLDALNAAWGTVVWSQTYTAWEEIYVPRLTIHNSSNPHLVLDYYRFVSESAISFCGMQAAIVKKYKKPGDFITTNGMFGHLDNHRMMDEALDVYAYDSYPNFAYCLSEDPGHSDDLNDRKWSRNLAEVRSICPHFLIMEQQSGANGWNTRMEAPTPKPGQMMLWTMQSIAHGADYVSFFRWRTAVVGTEMYWHGILDYDNRDNRKLAEVGQIWDRVQKLQPVAGADYVASVGLLRDYGILDVVSVDGYRLAKRSEKEIFVAAQLSHTPLDMVNLTDATSPDELRRYRLLIYPHPLILTEARAQTLRAYVENGGTLIVGARTGQKDIQGRCPMTPMPGLLSGLTGTRVKEFTFIGPMDAPSQMNWNGRPLPAGIFNDVLEAEAPDVEVLATYGTNFYAGEAALTERRVGAGRVCHFGGTFERETVDALLAYCSVRAPWSEAIRLPESCEIAVREKDGARWVFVLNYGWEVAEIELRQPMTDLDDGALAQGTICLKPFETRVYRL